MTRIRYVPTGAVALVALIVAGCTATTQTGADDEKIVVTAQKQKPAEAADTATLPPAPPPPPPMSAPAQTRAAGIVGPGYPMPAPYPQPADRERYDGEEVGSIKAVSNEPVSTFSVDVDTGSYANVRRFLQKGVMPPQAAVRTEEMINYFRYDYPLPRDRAQPFSVTTDLASTPWNKDTQLLRIGIRGYDIDYAERPAANLVFLVDVSGSMRSDDKLPLVKTALSMLADRLRPQDRISIVVYSGAAGLVLEPTADKAKIKAALEQLQAGGSTAGGAGLSLAYATARANLNKDGINRIVVATDGDFNVGVTNQETLEDMIERNRDDGITLTTLGFGEGNYNEALMELIADLGNGNYSYIDSAAEAKKVLDDEMSSTLFTIAKDVKIQVEFNPRYISEYRLIGYENRVLAEEDFDNDKVDAGDIGASHQVTALYELVRSGTKGWLPERRYDENKPAPTAGGLDKEMAFVKLRYKLPNGETSKLIEMPMQAGLLYNPPAPRGDMAFVTAVAAFGQKLRGDKYLGNFGYDDIGSLAGKQTDYYRQQFLELVALAKAKSPSQ